jgi:phytol kinase
MWLEPWFNDPLLQDGVAFILTLLSSLAFLRLMDAIAHRGVIDGRLSRKIIHIATGPIFILCWNLFSRGPTARWAAALVPLLITLQFALVGLGVMEDPAAIQAMTRSGDRREILQGPLYYGIVFVACTLIFWRTSPVGMIALLVMCGGDGLADIFGRRFGRRRLPYSRGKTWIGSLSMLTGGFLFSWVFLLAFNAWGVFQPSLDMVPATGNLLLICLACTLVEALPFKDIDNLTTTVTALVIGWLAYF